MHALAPPRCHQDVFPAAELGITPTADPAAINASWVGSHLDRIAPRLRELEEWGVLNASYIYAFDETDESFEAAIKLLFGEIKRRWPGVKTLAVLNWDCTSVVKYVDILVFQYQFLDDQNMANTRTNYVNAGKQVWGYHCQSPSHSMYLNTFVDVPPMKARLIPWLASAEQLSGWLYWYTNWGSRHAPSAVDRALGKLVPVPMLDDRGRSRYNAEVENPSGSGQFTNEDGNLLYAGERGPMSSVRLEQLRRGFEDWALLRLLEGKNRTQKAALSAKLVRGATNYTFDSNLLEATRREAALLIGKIEQC